MATAPQAETAVLDLYAHGYTAVTLDLSRLTFMDVAGLRLLISARSHARTPARSAVGSRSRSETAARAVSRS